MAVRHPSDVLDQVTVTKQCISHVNSDCISSPVHRIVATAKISPV
jgi:hypothetical protein